MPYKSKRVTVRFTMAEHAEYEQFMREAMPKDWTRLIRTAIREYVKMVKARAELAHAKAAADVTPGPARQGDPVGQIARPRKTVFNGGRFPGS